MVAVLFLDDLRARLEKAEFAFGDFVYLYIHREYWWRLYFGLVDEERLDGLQGAEVFDVFLRALCGAHYRGALGDGYLAGGILNFHRGIGAPGLVCEYFYDRV